MTHKHRPQHRPFEPHYTRTMPLGNQVLTTLLCIYLSLSPLLSQAAQSNKAQNGVPVIHIKAPNSKGISHNRYSKFNISKQGLILNNSGGISNTRLGGHIRGNPNLSDGRAARLIINEVTGAQASQLNGYLEVAGRPADVIIANPWGITCNGCGFINSPNVTLTTGLPQFNGPQLKGFKVQQGRVTLEGLGLNANNISSLTIMARAIELNAQLQAKQLKLITGRNVISQQTGAITPLAEDGSAKPQFALDASALGAMHAHQIHLIGTEAGVGVRTLAGMSSSVGDLVLNTQGQLQLKQLQARQQLSLTARDDIHLQGPVKAKKIRINTPKTLQQDSLMQAETIRIDAGTLNNQGEVLATNTLEVNSDELNNLAGQLYAGQTLLLNSDILNNHSTILSGAQLSLNSTEFNHYQGQIQALDHLSINAHDFSLMALATLDAGELLEMVLSGDLTLETDSQLISHAQLSLSIAGHVDNQGHISSTRSVNIASQSLDNHPTASIEAGQLLTIVVDEQLTNQGVISSEQQLFIEAENINNQTTGLIGAGDFLQLEARQAIINNNVLFSGNDMALYSDTLLNEQGDIFAINHLMMAKNDNGDKNSAITNRSGRIEAWQGNITLATEQLTNQRQQLNIGQRRLGLLPDDDSIFLLDTVFNGLTFDRRRATMDYFVGYWRDIYLAKIEAVTGLDATERNELISGLEQWLRASLYYGGPNCPNDDNCNVDNSAEMIAQLVKIARAKKHRWLAPYKAQLKQQTYPVTTRQWECNDVYDDCSYITWVTNQYQATEDYVISSTPEAQIMAGAHLNIDATLINNHSSTLSAGGNIVLTGTRLTNQGHALLLKETNQQRRIRCHWLDCDEGVTYNTQVKTTTQDTLPAYILAGGDILGDFSALINNKTIKTGVSYSSPGKLDKETDSSIPGSTPDEQIHNYSAMLTQSLADLGLPANGLFVINTDNNHPFLIETNPRFAQYGQFISSDYFLSLLGYPADTLPKRLGDGFYENRLIRDAVQQATGQRFLHQSLISDYQQYRYLMNNAAAQAQSLDLSLGVALSAEQVQQLSSDMVWLVEQTVNEQTVLVPVLYLLPGRQQLLASGALIHAGNNLQLQSAQISNSGTLGANNNTRLQSQQSLYNIEGQIQADNQLELFSQNHIINLSGQLNAAHVDITAGGDIISATLLTHLSDAGLDDEGNSYQTITPLLARQAAISSTLGDLNLSAHNIQLTHSQLDSANDIHLQAGNSIDINPLALQSRSYATFDKDNFQRLDALQYQSSSLTAAHDITLQAHKNISLHSAQLNAGNNIQLQAGNRLSLTSAQNSEQQDYYRESTESETTLKQYRLTTVPGQLKAGNTIALSGNNIHLQSTRLTSNQLTIDTKNQLTLAANKDIDSSFIHSIRDETFFTTDQGEERLDESVQYNQITVHGKTTADDSPAITLKARTIAITLAEKNGRKDTVADAGLTALLEALPKDTLSPQKQQAVITYRYLHEQHDYESWDEKSLNGLAQAVIMAVVTYFTMGAGLAVQGSVGATLTGTTGALAAATNGAIIASGSTFATGSINAVANHRSIGSEVFEQSLIAGVKGFATGYLGQTISLKVSSSLNLPGISSNPQLFNELIGKTSANTLIGLAEGGDGKQLLTQNLISGLVQLGSSQIDQWLPGQSLADISTNPSITSSLSQSLHSMNPSALILKAGLHAGSAKLTGQDINQSLSQFAFQVVGDIAQKQLTQALKQHQIASNSGNQDKQLYWQSQVSQWAEGGAYKVALHAITGGLMAQATGSDFKTGALVAGASQALAGALTEKLAPSSTNNLSLAHQQLNQQLKNQLHQQLATIVGGVTAQLSGEKAQVGMNIAGTADAFNRQLHQREVDAIKAQAEGFQRFAKQRGVILTEAQAEARLIRTMTRVADEQTAIDDGYRQDELAISYLGHNFIDVTPEDYKTSDINWDVVYNNPQTFANAQRYSGSGLTPQEVNARNNSAGAPVAKVLAASLAAYVTAPYALTAMESCLLNPVLCVNELGLVAGEVALEGSGLGVTGKSALKNSGKVPGGSVVTMHQGVDVAKEAVIGRKLEYLFGKATGRAHNIERSTDMLRQMERIGLPDTAANRKLMTNHFQGVLNDATNISGKGRNGEAIRESLLMGPNGGVKVESIWDKNTLQSFKLKGVGSRYRHLEN